MQWRRRRQKQKGPRFRACTIFTLRIIKLMLEIKDDYCAYVYIWKDEFQLDQIMRLVLRGSARTVAIFINATYEETKAPLLFSV